MCSKTDDSQLSSQFCMLKLREGSRAQIPTHNSPREPRVRHLHVIAGLLEGWAYIPVVKFWVTFNRFGQLDQ